MINHMTNDEWRSKSDDWHKGWRYAQGDDYVVPKNTSDFIEGYKYACNHPEGHTIRQMQLLVIKSIRMISRERL